MPFWLIQKTKIEADKVDELTHLLDRAGIEYELVRPKKGQILTADESDFKFDPNTSYFVCGSYPLSRYAHQQCRGSVFSLEDYSFDDLWQIFGKENFVNETARVCHSGAIFWSDEELFIRPLEDSKSFNGGIYNQNTFEKAAFSGMVLTAPLKHIAKEYRFFIIDQEIVSASLYKVNGSLMTSPIIDEGATEFVKTMMPLFPVEGYVIDVALVDGKYKIMELNCLNAAGFYDINLYRLINAVEDHYEKKSQTPKEVDEAVLGESSVLKTKM